MYTDGPQGSTGGLRVDLDPPAWLRGGNEDMASRGNAATPETTLAAGRLGHELPERHTGQPSAPDTFGTVSRPRPPAELSGLWEARTSHSFQRCLNRLSVQDLCLQLPEVRLRAAGLSRSRLLTLVGLVHQPVDEAEAMTTLLGALRPYILSALRSYERHYVRPQQPPWDIAKVRRVCIRVLGQLCRLPTDKQRQWWNGCQPVCSRLYWTEGILAGHAARSASDNLKAVLHSCRHIADRPLQQDLLRAIERGMRANNGVHPSGAIDCSRLLELLAELPTGPRGQRLCQSLLRFTGHPGRLGWLEHSGQRHDDLMQMAIELSELLPPTRAQPEPPDQQGGTRIVYLDGLPSPVFARLVQLFMADFVRRQREDRLEMVLASGHLPRRAELARAAARHGLALCRQDSRSQTYGREPSDAPD